MPELNIAVQLASLRQPFKKALPIVAEMGATAVELDARGEMNPRRLTQTGVRQIRKWLNDYNLKICAVSFRTRRGYDVEEDLQTRIDATKEAMKFAYSLGTSVVVNQVGRIDPESQESPAWRMLVEALTDLGSFAQHAGACLAMETGTESGEDMRQLIEQLPAGYVTVNFDPGNLIINGFSAREAVQVLGSHIVHVHAKDGVRDLAQGRGLEVALGRGSADFPALLGHLEEQHFRGFFTVEREQSSDPVSDISLAVQYLRNL